jgi:hypothetical protein
MNFSVLQHDEQGEPDSVVERDPVGWIGQGLASRRRYELNIAGVVGALPAGAGGLDLVEAQAAGHDDQPAALVLDLTEVRGHQARERVLHDVLGRADVPEHPECEINEVVTVVLVGLADRPAVLLTVHAASFQRVGSPRARGRPLRGCVPGAVARTWLLVLDDAALRIVTTQGHPRPGVTFPLRMSSLPVTCRSPPGAWHTGELTWNWSRAAS